MELNMLTPISNQLILEPLSSKAKRFVTYVITDNHLDSNGNHGNGNRPVNGLHRGHFQKWLDKELIREIKKSPDGTEVTLLSLGDFFDHNSSWKEDHMPYDSKGNLVSPEISNRVFDEIYLKNSGTINRISYFLENFENTRFAYTPGNHDKPVTMSDSIRTSMAAKLMPSLSPEKRLTKLLIAKKIVIPLLGLYGEHGHEYDPFNYSENNSLTSGDWITVKTNSLFRKIITKINSSSIPEEIKIKIVNKLHKAENIRPSAAVLMYLQFLAQKYHEKYKQNIPRIANEVRDIILSFSKEIGDVLQDFPVLHKLKKLGLYPERVMDIVLRNKTVQGLIGRAVSTIEYYKTDNNTSQIKEAKRLYEQEKQKGEKLKFFVAGHTHNLEHLIREFRYVNLGAWQPVIQAFREGYDWVFPEAILPAGVLKLETRLDSPQRRRKIKYTFDSFEEGKVKI